MGLTISGYLVRGNNVVTLDFRKIIFSNLRKIEERTKRLARIEERTKKEEVRRRNEGNIMGKALWFLPFPILTFGLGLWQMQRLEWKTRLLKEIDENFSKEAVKISSIAGMKPEEMQFRRVRLEGTFDHDQEMYVGPRVLKGMKGDNGYHVVTPFTLKDSKERILVNRGWVPTDQRDPSTRPDSQPKGEVVVEGTVRDDDIKNAFTPKNDIRNNEWFVVDVDQMSNVTDSLPFIVYSMPESNSVYGNNKLPIGIGSKPDLPNDHFQYALTWFTLSGLTLIGVYTLQRNKTRAKQMLKNASQIRLSTSPSRPSASSRQQQSTSSSS